MDPIAYESLYWCHNCNSEVILRPGSVPPTCSQCGGEFVELIGVDDHPELFINENNQRGNPAHLADGSQHAALFSMVSQILQRTSLPPVPANSNQRFAASVSFGPGGGVSYGTTIGPNNAVDPAGTDPIMGLLSSLFGRFQGSQGGIGASFGPQMAGDPGDYVFSQGRLDEIVSRLMEQHSRSNAPPAASDSLISSLPKVSITEEDVIKSKECPVCQDEFSVGKEVIKLPCSHLFDEACITAWLKVNGSCPVCRFSLVDSDAPRGSGSATGPGESGESDGSVESGLPSNGNPGSGPGRDTMPGTYDNTSSSTQQNTQQNTRGASTPSPAGPPECRTS